MTDSILHESGTVESEEETWHFRIRLDLLKEASALRRRDPSDFDSAPLTYFGLGGRDDGAIIERMRNDPAGSRIVSERISMPREILHPEPLADYPEESVGYQYWAHLQESQLDPLYLSTRSQEIAKRFPATAEHRFVYDRYRDSHDLWHVLLGYGTDMAGEAAIVAFTYAQLRNRGYLLIFLLNCLMCTKRGRPDVFRTAWQGYQHGKRTPLLMAIDWHQHLARPLDEVRREFGIEVARPYREFFIQDVPGAPSD